MGRKTAGAVASGSSLKRILGAVGIVVLFVGYAMFHAHTVAEHALYNAFPGWEVKVNLTFEPAWNFGMVSPEGMQFNRASSEAWGEAAIAAGEDPEVARAAVRATTAFYTGEPAP